MITENTKAVLLLTTFFNSKEVKQYKPLTENGYGYLACWLSQNNFKPEALLNSDQFDKVFALWDDPSSHTKPKKIVGFAKLEQTISDITRERLKSLTSRGASLSIALDKWTSAGIWVMDRQHPSYPKSIKTHLKHKCPALFFGVGNINLLKQPSIGFVGSRDCTQEDVEVTQSYVKALNNQGFQVVSGAAKGIDSESMLASINNGNSAIGIVADSLYRASGSGQWRQALRNDQLVLITPFYPEAGFTPKNAMARNKYIYMLSSSTIVVCSATKGGTWEGAKEDLKHGWVPLLVSTHANPLQAGNQALINGEGVTKPVIDARPISIKAIYDVFTEKQEDQPLDQTETKNQHDKLEANIASLERGDRQQSSAPQGDLFSDSGDGSGPTVYAQKTSDNLPNEKTLQPTKLENQSTEESSNTPSEADEANIEHMPLLSNFYQQLVGLITNSDTKLVSEDFIAKNYPEFELISKTALAKWLKHLIELGLIQRPSSRKKEYGLMPSNNKKLGSEK